MFKIFAYLNMNERHKTKILESIKHLRKVSFYDAGDFPSRYVAENIGFLQLLESFKFQSMRLSDTFLKKAIEGIDSDFDPTDNLSAIASYRKLSPILDEVEDYLILDDYESILNAIEVSEEANPNQIYEDSFLLKATKEVKEGNIEEALSILENRFEQKQLNQDNLILIHNQVNELKQNYHLGLIEFEEFLRNNSRIVYALIKEISKMVK